MPARCHAMHRLSGLLVGASRSTGVAWSWVTSDQPYQLARSKRQVSHLYAIRFLEIDAATEFIDFEVIKILMGTTNLVVVLWSLELANDA